MIAFQQDLHFLKNLCAILLHFRIHAFALSTDIEKAFFCILNYTHQIETLLDFCGCQILRALTLSLKRIGLLWYLSELQALPLCLEQY